jgi:small subunit ribosomal protein S6
MNHTRGVENVATNVYEGMFILDSNRYSRDASAVSGQVNDLVRKHGGEVLASRLWEERRLAYPIDGHRKGTYWLAYFRIDSAQITKINRECQLSDTILRSLVLKIDPRIADALVAHALSGGTASVRSKDAEAAEKARIETRQAERHAAAENAESVDEAEEATT